MKAEINGFIEQQSSKIKKKEEIAKVFFWDGVPHVLSPQSPKNHF